jgi:hypothetical protein
MDISAKNPIFIIKGKKEKKLICQNILFSYLRVNYTPTFEIIHKKSK